MTTFGMGLHISLDHIVFDTQRKQALVEHWKRCPAVVNNLYATHNRLSETIPLAQSWLMAFPDTRWTLRIHPDDGNHREPEYTDPLALYAEMRPYHEAGFTVLIDNESGFANGDEVKTYVDWTARYLDAAGKNGHSAAWGRTATGNPDKEYYPIFKPALLVNARYGDLHEYSPNEYMDRYGGGSGAIARYKHMLKVADDAGLLRPSTSIGEFGLAVGYDPEKGFRGIGTSEALYIQRMAETYRQWYQPNGVPVCLYLFPETVEPWQEMGLSMGALPEIRAIAKQHPDPIAIEVEPPPAPQPEPIVPELPDRDSAMWKHATLLIDGCRIRSAPFSKTVDGHTAGTVLKTLHVEDKLKVWLDPMQEADGYRWFGAWHGEHIGWMALVGETMTDQIAVTVPLEPEPEESPPTNGKPFDFRAYCVAELRLAQSEMLELDYEAQRFQAYLSRKSNQLEERIAFFQSFLDMEKTP